MTSWIAPALLLMAGAGVAFAYVSSPPRLEQVEGLPHALVAGSCLLSATVILARSRRPDAWRTAVWLGLGVLGLAAINAAFLIVDLRGLVPVRPTPYDVAFLAVAVMFLVPVWMEFRDHVAREDRREITADVALLSAAVGTMLYLYLSTGQPGTTASAAEFALIVATGFSAYGALALWLPNLAHIGLFAVMCGLSSAILTFAPQWIDGTFRTGQTMFVDSR